MKPLLNIIQKAIAFVASLTGTNAKLKEELDAANKLTAEQADTMQSQADTITTLKQQVADDEVDDEALETAASEAKAAAEAAAAARDEQQARADALRAELDEATAAGSELAGLINANPETPNVDENFVVQ